MINAVLHSKVEEAIRNLDIDEMIDIPTHEISSALTEAQLIMVNNYYASFEINEKARKCLTKLVKPYDSIDNVPFDYIPNATKWELSTFPSKICSSIYRTASSSLSNRFSMSLCPLSAYP